MTRYLKQILQTCGLYVKWRRNIPFGVDWMIDVDRFRRRRWEPRLAFDIGANVGQTTREMHRQWPDCVIHAFEPVSSTFGALAESIRGIPNAHSHQLGMSSAEATKDIHVLPGNVANSIRSDRMANEPGAQLETITLTTIDSFARKAGISCIDVLKTDTEGNDVDVLQGAREMLSAGKIRSVYAEVSFFDSDEWHSSFAGIYELLKPYGFQLRGLYDTGALISNRCGVAYCNAMFMAVRDEPLDATPKSE